MTKEQEKLFLDNTGLVYITVSKYFGKTHSMEPEDLIQTGFVGLARAVENYDKSLGYKFSTYAVECIRYTVLDEMRNTDRLIRVPQYMQQLIAEYEKEKELSNVDIKEFIEKKNCYEHGLIQAIYANSSYISYDCQPYTGENEVIEDLLLKDIISDDSNVAEAAIYYRELSDIVSESIGIIASITPKRNMNMFKLYYGFGCTPHKYHEISKMYGISIERVRQIVSKITKKIKDYLPISKEYLECCDEYDFIKYSDTNNQYEVDEYER